MVAQNIGLIILVILTASCSSMSGYPARPDSSELKLISLQNKYFLPKVDVLEEYQKLTGDEDKQLTYRNTIAHGRMLALDMQFSLFKEAIYSEGITSNLSFDIAGVLTGVAGAAVTNVEASRILSALSGGIAGSQTAVNKNLYFERTMPALLALMDSERKKVRTQILEGLLQPADIYPLGYALADLERYYEVGSIPGAIASITTVAGQQDQRASEQLIAMREESFVDIAAVKQIDTALDLTSSLKKEAAWQIIKGPPSPIDDYTKTAVANRLGKSDFINVDLSGPENDDKAKAILKMILVLINDRSAINTGKWLATLKAEQEN